MRTPAGCLSRGFSLIEVLVSVVVVGTVFFSLYAGISFGFATLGLSREELRATQVLAEKMETIRLYNWEQVNSNGFIPSTFTAPFDATTNGSSGITYTGTVAIVTPSIAEGYSNDLRLITVQVEWQSAQVLRQRSMSTYVSRYGLQNYVY
jgi:prepilin-type N-terminal cleavage/methylation domain-containing protein